MPINAIYAALQLPAAATLHVHDLAHQHWGQSLLFTAQATLPTQETMPFQLRFADCREMRWQLYTHMSQDHAEAFPITELVDAKLGRDQHRSPAYLLTDHFGLRLSYGTASLILPDERLIPLGS